MTTSRRHDTRGPVKSVIACLGVLSLLHAGCATTVHRLGGPEVTLPAGAPVNDCEKEAWLILAPTSREVPSGRQTVTHEDGLGMYRVGGTDPESIPGHEEDLGSSPLVARHKKGVESHDRKRVIASGLGVVGVAAFVVGTILFVDGLSQTKKVTNRETGLKEDEADVDGTKAGWGAGIALVGGFGFGAAGLAVNPSGKEGAEADAARYVFTPDDGFEKVRWTINEHNLSVRKGCAARGAAGSAEASTATDRPAADAPAEPSGASPDVAPADEENPL